ncbi:class A beta-lactamase-related serine hydrolase [Burkholderiaceae bacterium FT117]|uniref:serine hydrolase n=1 Tax=Zeimonas sediminis TaxID=2944268 RepID=UPI002342C554|nr:serine hydrolase [Zeimonas sediminis]MCM5570087.1 class A beta-lactamase-related serine hydrolase [Zeimonas sediminis]
MILRRILCRLSLLLAALSAPLAVHAASGVLPELRQARDAALQAGLERVVRELGLEEAVRARRLALALVDATRPGAPRLAMINGDHMMYAASLPKIAILLGALAEAEDGRMPIDADLLAAMTNMIRYSSNEDATRVLRQVGEERLLEILQSPRFRLYDPELGGGLWVGKSYGRQSAYRRDPLHNFSHGATAFQVARLYYLLANDRLLAPPLNALMKDVLSNPGIRHKFVAGLEARPGGAVFRKSGTWRNHHADSVLVEHGAHRYILVGIADDADGGEWLLRLAAPLHDLVTAPIGR